MFTESPSGSDYSVVERFYREPIFHAHSGSEKNFKFSIFEIFKSKPTAEN